jgi:hypothetical protein
MPSEGDRVRVPNPVGPGHVEASFRRHGDQGDLLLIDDRKVEVGWVRYEEGEQEGAIAAVPYSDIKPV